MAASTACRGFFRARRDPSARFAHRALRVLRGRQSARRSSFLSGFGDVEATGDVPSERDAQLAEALGFVKKGRMDRALQLAATLAQQPTDAGRFLAEQCSHRAAAAYLNSQEAREMAVGLVVAGTTFDIPGRDVKLIRPKQLVEGFWLRKVSDVHDLAESGRRLAKASLALGEGQPWPFAARDWQLLARCSVLRLQTCQSQAVLQAYIGKRIQGDGSLLPKLPALWAIFVKSGKHLREALLSPEPPGPLDEGAAGADLPSADVGLFRALAEQRQRAAARQMEILTECISEAATGGLFEAEDGLDLLQVAEGMFKVDCPPEIRQSSLKILRATATVLRER
ncbi:unnamed protein product [Durusdinium trenchii]|uniref:Uncharacterized protein n=1 Tax=Durusdinium trenchii TaxID=1381693 RepID=A0ABP0PW09_9DINO